jgi:hypothetical protein
MTPEVRFAAVERRLNESLVDTAGNIVVLVGLQATTAPGNLLASGLQVVVRGIGKTRKHEAASSGNQFHDTNRVDLREANSQRGV